MGCQMRNEKVNGIYIEREWGDCDITETKRSDIAGFSIMCVYQKVKRVNGEEKRIVERKRKRIHSQKIRKCDKKLRKIIKKYCKKETIVIGNEQAVKELELRPVLFLARKQELLINVDDLFGVLAGEKKNVLDRSCCLIVLESEQWSKYELLHILKKIKDKYEDIYIESDTEQMYLEWITTFFYEEYGVVMNVISDSEGKQLQANTTLLLIEYWDEHYREYIHGNGYVVAQWEEGLVRKRRNLRKAFVNKSCGQLYAGFVYESKKRAIPYEWGVLLSCSSDLQHSIQDFVKENPISSVAIYGVE